MKPLLLIQFLVCMLPGQQQHNELFGKWKLIKVETNDGVLMPTMDFFLTIRDNTFYFNRDANRCSAKAIVTDTTIELGSEFCTRMCCDGREDPIGGLMLYRGSYVVTEKTLVISNDEFKTYLEKVEN